MATEPKTLRRPALVYPNIDIKDVNWLKATLVSFPRVVRMVPRECVPNDSFEVQAFADYHDSYGQPFLGPEFIDVMDTSGKESPAYQAQGMLRNELQDNIKYVREKFSPQHGGRLPFGVEPYKLKVAKIEKPFYEFLFSNDLVYEETPNDPESHGMRSLCLHPRLGDAVMTVSAISIANAKGYDIVTDSTEYHLAVATLNEQAVVQQLLGRFPDRSKSQSDQEKADEFAQVIIATYFDVKDLTAEKIEELHQSEEFLAFKDALIGLVNRMPQIDSISARNEQYEVMAREVVEKWQGTKKFFSVKNAEILLDATNAKPPQVATELMATGATWLSYLAGSGIMVGALAIQGVGVYRKYREIQASSRYLSKLIDSGAVLAGGPIGAFAGNPEYGRRID